MLNQQTLISGSYVCKYMSVVQQINGNDYIAILYVANSHAISNEKAAEAKYTQKYINMIVVMQLII